MTVFATIINAAGRERSRDFLAPAFGALNGRGVFLDVARALGEESLEDGYGVTCADLDMTAKKQKVEFKRGDYIIVRTGQMERCLKAGNFGDYPDGDAPGFAFETLEFVAKTVLARADDVIE
jgi:hypothetical protein